jgi:hypothetical protein
MLAGVAAVVLLVGSAAASDDDLVFRALGFYQGKAEVSEDSIKCEIPSISTAFADGSFSMGLWNTFGNETRIFPDPNHPFGNPCGGWLQLRSNLLNQAIILDRVRITRKIRGANRFRRDVPLRRGWPVACSNLRRESLFLSTQLNPVNSSLDSSNSGAPNVAFVQLTAMMPPDVFLCLQNAFGRLPATTFQSLSVQI